MSKIVCSECGCEIVRDVYHRLRGGKILCRSCFDAEIETPRFLFELKQLVKSKSLEELVSSSRAKFLVEYLYSRVSMEEKIGDMSFGELYKLIMQR